MLKKNETNDFKFCLVIMLLGFIGLSPLFSFIPAYGQAPKTSIDLNTASEKDLESIKGVGPATAKKIISGRPYGSVEDLKKAGIPAKTIESMRPYVKVGTAPATSTPTTGATKTPSKAVSKASAKPTPGQKVNINTATKEQLESVPGIGAVKAQAIIDGRPFKKIEDIMKVKGIKEGTFNKIKDFITVQ